MSEIIIHGVPGSPYVRMPLITCEEKGAPYRLSPMGMGDSRAPAHLARQPFGRIPAMEHGDFQLYEAQAIVRYIDQVCPGRSLTPADARARARMNQVMGIVDWYVMPSISSGLAFNRVIKPMFGMPVDEAAVAAALPQARTCVAALADILGDQTYFTGDAISLADIAAAAHLDFMPLFPEGRDMLTGSPLAAWLQRMMSRPSLQKTTMAALRAALEPQPA
ncbi:glutathione S-transferase family protein [Phenylobacterium sp.]|uniref:glutathione S-transferase family protein n=1 Tax=Phenylobacterium sp. TaxID=1871053 RepID=UPI00286A8F5E|nr:glutathione S-transferase family protein [Phenylobacterium sp.]